MTDDPEIIAVDNTGQRLIAFNHDGTFKWRSGNLSAINWGAPSIADLNKDGTPEIIVGRQVLSNAGTLLWTGAGGSASGGIVGPLSLVSDVNGDGKPDVVAGNTVYDVAGAVQHQNAQLPDGYNAVGNFDGDSKAEIVLVANGQVWLFEDDITVSGVRSQFPAAAMVVRRPLPISMAMANRKLVWRGQADTSCSKPMVRSNGRQ